jgi:hypothetical protein
MEQCLLIIPPWDATHHELTAPFLLFTDQPVDIVQPKHPGAAIIRITGGDDSVNFEYEGEELRREFD